jgi:cytochrome c-type biogenesis protein CcmH/NrfG
MDERLSQQTTSEQNISPLPEPTSEDTKEIRKRIFVFGVIASLILIVALGVTTYFAKINYDKVSAEAQKAQQEIEALKQKRAEDPATGW